MFNDSRHGLRPARDSEARAQVGEVETYRFKPHEWVPNHSRLPVLVYRDVFGTRHVDQARARHHHARSHRTDRGDDLASAFESLFERNAWPPQWRDGIFDFHHFHSTAHEVLGVASGEADVIVGGPNGRVLRLEAGDVLLLPAGTGHCLQAHEGRFLIVGGYPAGQQWDIRREALDANELAAMNALPFPASDPVGGASGPVLSSWMQAR